MNKFSHVSFLSDYGTQDEFVGVVKAVIAELEAEMITASGKLEFERAAVLRDQVEALHSGDYKKAAKPKSKTTYGKSSGGRKKSR